MGSLQNKKYDNVVRNCKNIGEHFTFGGQHRGVFFVFNNRGVRPKSPVGTLNVVYLSQGPILV